jgi:hypothetical protein
MNSLHLNTRYLAGAIQTGIPANGATGFPAGHMVQHNVTGDIWRNIGDESYAIYTDFKTNRWLSEERFARLPYLNANVAVGTNLDYELLGTNAAAADQIAAAGTPSYGGFRLSTHAGAADSALILPHKTAKQASLVKAGVATQSLPLFECTFRTAVAANGITKTCIVAGLKLTEAVDVGTDNDGVFFRYSASGTGLTYWTVVANRTGTDVETVTTVLCAASTWYNLRIMVDGTMVPRCYINGVKVATLAALTTNIPLLPHIGILAETDAVAKYIYPTYLAVGGQLAL